MWWRPGCCTATGAISSTARTFPTPAAGLFGRRSPLTRLMPNNRWSARYLSGRQRTGEEPFAVDWVSGAAMLVPRRVIEEVGALDEGFFLFWEDADWCHRIKDAGYAVWCVPAARVVHHEGGSRGFGWTPATDQALPPGGLPLLVQAPCPAAVEPPALDRGDLAGGARGTAPGALDAGRTPLDRRPEPASGGQFPPS